MKVIIAGSRSITDIKKVYEAVMESCIPITEVVCGMARGVDTLGLQYAKECELPVAEFPAEWGKLGRSAGYLRNAQMADYADALIAVWDGVSKGTNNMIQLARHKKLEVFVKIVAPST